MNKLKILELLLKEDAKELINNRIKIAEHILSLDDESSEKKCFNSPALLEIGKKYLIRTITMIYTGEIKKINGDEIVITKAAWIPETERWADCVKDCVFKEVEPYFNDVLLYKSTFSDATEIHTLPLVQK